MLARRRRSSQANLHVPEPRPAGSGPAGLLPRSRVLIVSQATSDGVVVCLRDLVRVAWAGRVRRGDRLSPAPAVKLEHPRPAAPSAARPAAPASTAGPGSASEVICPNTCPKKILRAAALSCRRWVHRMTVSLRHTTSRPRRRKSLQNALIADRTRGLAVMHTCVAAIVARHSQLLGPAFHFPQHPGLSMILAGAIGHCGQT